MEDPNPLHWRDRLALQIMAWIAAVLFTEAIPRKERAELDAMRTTLHVGREGRGW